MIPRIYDENFTEYDSNGLGLLKDIIECTVDEELNGDFELVFKYPVKGFLFEYLQRENIIKADASNSLKGQLFRIYNITKAFDGIVTVYAKHITHDLANYSLNEDINQENVNCENAGNYMLSKSDAPNKFQIHSNVDMLGNYKLDRRNDCMSAIIGVRGSLIDTYGNGAKILKNNFDISILKRRGSDNNVLIAYAKNLTGFELIEDTSDMITRIKPYATYSPQQTESETDNTNEEKTIYLDEIYVDSDRIDKYQTIKSKWIDFSEKFENTTPTKEKLKLYANAYFADNNCDIPKLTYKIEFQPLSYTEEYKEYKILEDISMDDGVCIFNKKYGIKDEVRVIKTKYDVLKERYISIELGDPRTTFKDLISESKDGKDGKDGEDGQDGLNGADGVNGEDGTSIIWKGSFDTHPSNPENGWAYYNINDKRSYVYQDGAWYQMTIDGQDGIDGNNGADGLSIVWKGELTSPPENPQENWVYKDTDNGIVYIYTGTAWEVMTYDGTDGTDGAKGDNGNSVYITYNDSSAQPSLPIGNGTTNGWHTDCTENVVWMSQKVSTSSDTGDWGTPIRIRGKDADLTDFPDDLPSVPTLKVVRAGFKSISLSWNFVNKPHYNYELYASQTKDFTPTEYDLIFKGMGSAYLHEVECSQTWYYKLRVVNTYNSATNFSNQVSATTAKIDDASTYFKDAAIGSALIGSLNADVINSGKVKGIYIDAKNLTVIDGNGNTTLSVDDTGNVAIQSNTFNLKTTNLTLSSTNELLEITHEDGSYTSISPGGFMLYQASTGNKYKCLVSTGYFSITGSGTSTITLPAKFDNVEYWDIDIFYSIETNWGASSSMVDKCCIYEMYANDIFQIGMEKDSNGHWTKKVDYSLKDVCVKAGASMQIGDIGNMNGFVHWIALA